MLMGLNTAQPVTQRTIDQLPKPDGNYIGESFHRIFVYAGSGEEPKGTVSGGYIGGDR